MFGCGDDEEAVSPPQAFREIASDVSAQQPIVITVELHHVLSRLSPRQELWPTMPSVLQNQPGAFLTHESTWLRR
jgi:hypothetical protein